MNSAHFSDPGPALSCFRRTADDTGPKLLAKDGNTGRSLDPQADLVSLDLDNGYNNGIGDDQTLAQLAR